MQKATTREPRMGRSTFSTSYVAHLLVDKRIQRIAPSSFPFSCSSSVIARDCINVFLPKRSLLREHYKDQPLRRTAFASRPLREITQCPISSLLLSFPFFLFRLYESRPAPRTSNVSKLLPQISRDCMRSDGSVNRARDDSDGYEASVRAPDRDRKDIPRRRLYHA